MKIYTATGELKYEKLILGSQLGMALSKRGKNDNHIILTPLVEDDEQWSVSSSGFSSYYLEEFIEITKKTQEYLKSNCTKDENFGWKF